MRSRNTDRPTARRLRRGALAFLIGAATGLSGVTLAHASPPMTAHTVPQNAGQLVTLITGDRVLSHDGVNSVLPAPGSTGSLDSYQAGDGDRYFVPSFAVPYLSGELDPSLFDATALAAAGATDQVPVRLTFAAGTTPAAPPGITVTSVSGSTAIGYLTTASGPVFAAGLRARSAEDRAAGRPAGSTPLAPGLLSVSLATAPAPPVATPHYPLHVLQLNAQDLTGKPADFALALLYDADNVRTVSTIVPLTGGLGKVQVPAGHYTVIAQFDDLDASGSSLTAVHTVVRELTVADTGNTTATIAESAATAQVGVSTPKPATPALMVTNYVRTDAAGNSSSFGQLDFGAPPPTYVSPVPATAIGTLGYQVEWAGGSPDPSQNYRYDVAFGSANGIPAQQQETVTQDQIATVHDTLFADPAGKTAQDSLLVGAIDPAGGWLVGMPSAAPGEVTDYLASTVGNVWQQEDFRANDLVFDGDAQTYAPGRDYRVDWAHGPIAANLGQHGGQQFCLACSAGSTVLLAFNPIGDSDPTQAGQLYTNPTSAHFTLYRDGATVFDQDGASGAELDNVPTGRATYRAVFDLSLAGVTGVSQSTVTHTDATLRYDPAATGVTLPSQSTCPGSSASTPCAVLPMLDLNYRLATDESNTSGSPVQVLNLRVGHAGYDGAGSRSPITGASVQVSFDNGGTWQRVPTIGFAGSYVALWPNKAGTEPSIRVSASDANGDTITQTVTDAYTAAARH